MCSAVHAAYLHNIAGEYQVRLGGIFEWYVFCFARGGPEGQPPHESTPNFCITHATHFQGGVGPLYPHLQDCTGLKHFELKLGPRRTDYLPPTVGFWLRVRSPLAAPTLDPHQGPSTRFMKAPEHQTPNNTALSDSSTCSVRRALRQLIILYNRPNAVSPEVNGPWATESQSERVNQADSDTPRPAHV